MKTATLLALGSFAGVASATSHNSFRRERRAHALEVRAPGSDASTGSFGNASLEKRADVLEGIALVAKLSLPTVASPVEASVVDQEARAAKLAAKKAAIAAKKVAVAKAKAQRIAKAKAEAAERTAEKAAKQAAADKAAADKAAADKAAAEQAAKAAKAPKVQVKAASSEKVFSGKSKGLIGYVDERCGPSGATPENPNGSEGWLMCGLSRENPDSGWTPPSGVTLQSIATVTLEDAVAKNDVFKKCEPFFHIFESAEKETGVPAILLASLALQESTCRPDVIGDHGGAFGLMQLTAEKCGSSPGGNCLDPWWNVHFAARFFKDLQDSQGFLQALGGYNGITAGLSYATATRYAGQQAQCLWQQNLDYLHQMLNGWVLGRSGYAMGSFRNLDSCGSH